MVLCSTLISLLLVEVLLRAAIFIGVIDYPNPDYDKIIHRYSNNIDLIYELKPSAHTNYQGALIRTNSWGMRDRQYSLKKPADTVRIAVIGDSVTFGHNLSSYLDTWPEILEEKLNQSGQQKFEVLNFSVVGYNSFQEQIVLEEKIVEFAPDIVLLGFCMNDDSYTDGLAELARQTAPWSLGSKLHSKLLSYLMHKYERIFFSSMNNRQKIDNLFAALADLSSKKGFEVLILIFPQLFESWENYDAKQLHTYVKDLADRHSLAAIDFNQQWQDMNFSEKTKLYLPNDDTHFSKYGMKKIAEALLSVSLIHQR